jgi:hypothetical protein
MAAPGLSPVVPVSVSLLYFPDVSVRHTRCRYEFPCMLPAQTLRRHLSRSCTSEIVHTHNMAVRHSMTGTPLETMCVLLLIGHGCGPSGRINVFHALACSIHLFDPDHAHSNIECLLEYLGSYPRRKGDTYVRLELSVPTNSRMPGCLPDHPSGKSCPTKKGAGRTEERTDITSPRRDSLSNPSILFAEHDRPTM